MKKIPFVSLVILSLSILSLPVYAEGSGTTETTDAAASSVAPPVVEAKAKPIPPEEKELQELAKKLEEAIQKYGFIALIESVDWKKATDTFLKKNDLVLKKKGQEIFYARMAAAGKGILYSRLTARKMSGHASMGRQPGALQYTSPTFEFFGSVKAKENLATFRTQEIAASMVFAGPRYPNYLTAKLRINPSYVSPELANSEGALSDPGKRPPWASFFFSPEVLVEELSLLRSGETLADLLETSFFLLPGASDALTKLNEEQQTRLAELRKTFRFQMMLSQPDKLPSAYSLFRGLPANEKLRKNNLLLFVDALNSVSGSEAIFKEYVAKFQKQFPHDPACQYRLLRNCVRQMMRSQRSSELTKSQLRMKMLQQFIAIDPLLQKMVKETKDPLFEQVKIPLTQLFVQFYVKTAGDDAASQKLVQKQIEKIEQGVSAMLARLIKEGHADAQTYLYQFSMAIQTQNEEAIKECFTALSKMLGELIVGERFYQANQLLSRLTRTFGQQQVENILGSLPSQKNVFPFRTYNTSQILLETEGQRDPRFLYDVQRMLFTFPLAYQKMLYQSINGASMFRDKKQQQERLQDSLRILALGSQLFTAMHKAKLSPEELGNAVAAYEALPEGQNKAIVLSFVPGAPSEKELMKALWNDLAEKTYKLLTTDPNKEEKPEPAKPVFGPQLPKAGPQFKSPVKDQQEVAKLLVQFRDRFDVKKVFDPTVSYVIVTSITQMLPPKEAWEVLQKYDALVGALVKKDFPTAKKEYEAIGELCKKSNNPRLGGMLLSRFLIALPNGSQFREWIYNSSEGN